MFQAVWLIVNGMFLSVFDREDDTSRSGGSLAALEHRQAERKKELMRAQTMPKSSASQARKAMIEKLEKDGGGWAASLYIIWCHFDIVIKT